MMMRLAFGAFSSVTLLLATPAVAQNAGAGAALFKQRCQTCHSVTPGQKALLGPNLSSLQGRKAGSSTFNYSPALRASGLTWNKVTLDRFLTAPMKVVPGTRMVVSVPDAKQRTDLLAYLASLK